MDQKRTLWIVAAAGVFLLVVFGIAVILSAPAAKQTRTISNNPQQQQSNWIAKQAEENNKNASQDLLSPITNENFENSEKTETAATAGTAAGATEIADMTVISQNTSIYVPQVNGESAISLNTIPSSDMPGGNIVATNKAGKDAMAAAQSASSAKPAQPITEKPVVPANQPASAATTTSKASAPAASTSKAKQPQPAVASVSRPAATASVRASETKTATKQYWVQAASFTSKKSADNAVVLLDENMIPSNIFTYQDANGTMYYRIRVGPYITKNEAEYWQSKIAKIETFAETKSYVTETAAAN